MSNSVKSSHSDKIQKSSPLKPKKPVVDESPSILAVLFSPNVPPRPPHSAIGRFLWRRRIWFECTFAFTLLETWEKVLLMTFLILAFFLVLTAMVQYLPRHLTFMKNRAAYYWYGGDVPSSAWF